MRSKKFIYCLFLIISLLGCSNKPSDTVLKQSIGECINKQVPPSWAGSLLGGKNAKVELIEIQQIGDYNEQYRYWPIKARVKGYCQADYLFKTETKSFDKVGDFRVVKDDYGNYKASFVGY